MKTIKGWFFGLLGLVLFTGGMILAESTDVRGSKDHPLFNRMSGYFIEYYEEKDFDAVTFRKGDQDVTVEGRYVSINYRSVNDEKYPSTLQILRNYINAAQKIGGKLMCQDEFEAHLRIAKSGGETWIKVYVSDDGWQYTLTIIEKGGMEQSIVADAASLANSIQNTGKVALYGIYFDTGKADVKSESEPALKEIAKLMQANPKLKLLVVGHTDNVGKIDANMLLSKQRAEAVVKALVSKHGVSATRLLGCGAGPMAPVASNKDEAGRSLNRRVELVEQ